MSIGGLILAGGRSSRMGSPKPDLLFGGETLLARAARVVGEVVQPVVVVIGADQPEPVIAGVAIVRDEEPDGGPLVGLLAGLEWLSRHGATAAFVTGCDTPFLAGDVIRAIINAAIGAEVAAPRVAGRWHPLAGVYETSLIPLIRERLESGRRSLVGLIEQAGGRAIEPGVLERVDPEGLSLVNVNTPDNYARAIERAGMGAPLALAMENQSGITCRPARPEDVAAISALVTDSARQFIAPDYSATGAAVLLEGMSEDETAARLAKGFRYLVAVEGETIVGVGAMKENAHLYHLFVAETHHRRGIARRLWELLRDEALANGNRGRITVNSSRYAVPVYLRLGFVKDGGITARDEITCQPMVWQIAPRETADDEEDRKI